jgi:hypothetical protein
MVSRHVSQALKTGERRQCLLFCRQSDECGCLKIGNCCSGLGKNVAVGRHSLVSRRPVAGGPSTVAVSRAMSCAECGDNSREYRRGLAPSHQDCGAAVENSDRLNAAE